LWWVFGGAALSLGLVLYTPWLRGLFLFAPLSRLDLAICFAAGFASILWFEGLKVANNLRKRSL